MSGIICRNLRRNEDSWCYICLLLAFQRDDDPWMARCILACIGLLYPSLIKYQPVAPGLHCRTKSPKVTAHLRQTRLRRRPMKVGVFTTP
jgi:hypothetical protein